MSCQVEMLKREVEQSLQERDKAMRESHDLRYDIGYRQSIMNSFL